MACLAVNQGDAGFKGRRGRDQGEVVRLLHRAGRKHGPAGLTDGHHVLVVAEDGQALRGNRARRHVEDGAGELAGERPRPPREPDRRSSFNGV